MANKRNQNSNRNYNPTRRNDMDSSVRFRRSSQKYESEYRYMDRERDRQEIAGMGAHRNGLRKGIEHKSNDLYHERKYFNDNADQNFFDERDDHNDRFHGLRKGDHSRDRYENRDIDQQKRNKKYGAYTSDKKSGNDLYKTEDSKKLTGEDLRKRYASIIKKKSN